MQNAAFATFQVLRTTAKAMEVYVEVDSTSGWLGACVLFVRRGGDAQSAAYNEAERRAVAQGLTLQWLRAA